MRCAFDNDRAGENLWTKVRDAYPDEPTIVRDCPPAGAKDWNDALHTERGMVGGHQERARGPERGRERDTRDARADERR